MTLPASPFFFFICCSRSWVDALMTHDTYLRSYARRKPIRWKRPKNNVKINPKIRVDGRSGRMAPPRTGTAGSPAGDVMAFVHAVDGTV